MASPKDLAEPHKELRFTRSAQGQAFLLIAALFLTLALVLLANWWRGHPSFHPWMALPPLLIATLITRIALRCTRHAYLILTPLGIEIFPLIKPEKNLNLVYWDQIHTAEFDPDLTTLKLHFNQAQTGGIILSLKPISETQRPLLEKAILGRLAP